MPEGQTTERFFQISHNSYKYCVVLDGLIAQDRRLRLTTRYLLGCQHEYAAVFQKRVRGHQIQQLLIPRLRLFVYLHLAVLCIDFAPALRITRDK